MEKIEKKELKALLKKLKIEINRKIADYKQVNKELSKCEKQISKLDKDRVDLGFTRESADYSGLTDKKEKLRKEIHDLIIDLSSFKTLMVSKRPYTRMARKVAKRGGYASVEGYLADHIEYNQNIIERVIGFDSQLSSPQKSYLISHIPNRVVNKVSRHQKH